MSSSTLIPIISSIITLIGVCITSFMSNRQAMDKIQQKLQVTQAITEERLTELTREVRTHNNFAQRMPVVEKEIEVINHRIKDLEQEVKQHES